MTTISIMSRRSVRALPLGLGRSSLVVMLSLCSMATTALTSARMLEFQSQICVFLLEMSGISWIGLRPVSVFRLEVAVPVIPATPSPIPIYRCGIIALALAVAVAIVVAACVPLVRGVLLFGLLLLGAGLVGTWFNGSADYLTFACAWVRTSFLTWLILPWITGLLLVTCEPSVLIIGAWMTSVQICALFWSTIRLVFCLGMLDLAGMWVAPLLQFGVGMLADVLLVVFIYSLAAWRSAGTAGSSGTQ